MAALTPHVERNEEIVVAQKRKVEKLSQRWDALYSGLGELETAMIPWDNKCSRKFGKILAPLEELYKVKFEEVKESPTGSDLYCTVHFKVKMVPVFMMIFSVMYLCIVHFTRCKELTQFWGPWYPSVMSCPHVYSHMVCPRIKFLGHFLVIHSLTSWLWLNGVAALDILLTSHRFSKTCCKFQYVVRIASYCNSHSSHFIKIWYLHTCMSVCICDKISLIARKYIVWFNRVYLLFCISYNNSIIFRKLCRDLHKW